MQRSVDPQDKRGRLVELTDKGHSALADADRIKGELTSAFEQRLGKDRLAELEALLDAMVEL